LTVSQFPESPERHHSGIAKITRRLVTSRLIGTTAVVAVAAVGGPLRTMAAPMSTDSTQPVDYQDDGGAAAHALVPEATGTLLEIYPAGALHVVGQERFALGVVDPDTGPIENASLDLLFFKVANNQGTLTETLQPTFFPYGAKERHMDMGTEDQQEGDITGIYIARPNFDAAGNWGVVVRTTMPDGSVRAGQADFTVAADTDVPGPGDPAIASKTAVATTPEEIAKICTADPVDDMHAVSLDQALQNGKPTLVLFATPALCTSRVCGPSLEALEALEPQYRDTANFIHVEIYPERDYNKPAAAVDEWHLPSEPWLFLIDGTGNVVERYEGGIGLTEIEPAVKNLVGA
jgi:hypothetical protein